ERRADPLARQTAVAETEARLRLEIANRFGNPNLGPAYEYDPGRINLIGMQITLPLPVCNTRRGEILQREAERSKAALELRQAEIQVDQDIRVALSRLEKARTWADTYRLQVRPNLEACLKDIRELYQTGAEGVAGLKVPEIRRKVLKARDGELAALLEVRQAWADLAAAAGDFTLALTPSP